MAGRRVVIAGLVVACIAGLSGLLGVESAGAGKPVITASGDLACSGFGKSKTLTSGSAPAFNALSAFKTKPGCTGTTGTPGVTILKAKLQGVFTHTGDCSPDYAWTFIISWKSKQAKVHSTTVVFSNAQATPQGWTMPGPGGTSTVTGSWAGTNTASAVVTGSPATIEGHCTGGPDPKGRPRKLVGGAGVTLFL
jgi:hypothetical protein